MQSELMMKVSGSCIKACMEQVPQKLPFIKRAYAQLGAIRNLQLVNHVGCVWMFCQWL